MAFYGIFGFDSQTVYPSLGEYLSAVKPTFAHYVAVFTHRHAWIGGNLAAIQAICEALERQGIGAIPVFSSNDASSPDFAELADLLAGIEHTGTAVMTVAYRREQIKHPLDGMGAVVPGVEKSPILALSFSNEKYPHRAPAGHSLLRVFAGGARNPDMAEKSEAEIRDILLLAVAEILGITGEPLLVSVSRWPRTMPQFHLGHLERIAKIEEILQKFPTLAVAGNAFTGVGIPHCIHSGEQAAEKVVSF